MMWNGVNVAFYSVSLMRMFVCLWLLVLLRIYAEFMESSNWDNMPQHDIDSIHTEPAIPCFILLMPSATQGNKYFKVCGMTWPWGRTPDLPHSRQTIYPLHHGCRYSNYTFSVETWCMVCITYLFKLFVYVYMCIYSRTIAGVCCFRAKPVQFVSTCNWQAHITGYAPCIYSTVLLVEFVGSEQNLYFETICPYKQLTSTHYRIRPMQNHLKHLSRFTVNKDHCPVWQPLPFAFMLTDGLLTIINKTR